MSSYDPVTATFAASIANVSGVGFGGYYLGELAGHLLLANINQSAGGPLGYRFSWSQEGVGSQWNPAANINAGFNDIIEVPTIITGLEMAGRVGYVFYQDGIIEVAPTGQGTAPFDFNHVNSSLTGVGNVVQGAASSYGNTVGFVSRDDIHVLKDFSVQDIGGGARDAIFADLELSRGTIGVMVPYLRSGINPQVFAGSGPTYAYMLYMLFCNISIGQKFNTKVWVYDFADQSWTNFFLPNITLTGKPALAAINKVIYLLFPCVDSSSIPTLHPRLGIFDITDFDDPIQSCTHSFKVEDIAYNRYPSVRRVVLTYRDLGVATLTVTVTGSNDNGQVISNSQTQTIGNAVPTNKLLTKFFDVQLSCFRPQLTIYRAAGGGPVSISTATMLGHLENQSL